MLLAILAAICAGLSLCSSSSADFTCDLQGNLQITTPRGDGTVIIDGTIDIKALASATMTLEKDTKVLVKEMKQIVGLQSEQQVRPHSWKLACKYPSQRTLASHAAVIEELLAFKADAETSLAWLQVGAAL
jgi:alkyl hydroperoxide reductase subunit AhpC